MDAIWNFLVQQDIKINDLEGLKHTTLILLLLPLVITIGGISRYIIGLKTLNIYISTILTFAFLEFGYINNNFSFKRGLFYGIVMLVSTFLTSTLLYIYIKRLRMHYIPKLSLVVTAVSITTLILMIIFIFIDRNRFITVSPMIIVMMVIISEGFMSVLAKKNYRYTIGITLETLLTSIISYIIISWSTLQHFLLTYPITILAVIFLNIYVGRFTGLRLSEYWRFRNIIFNNNTDNNDQPNSNTKK